MHGFTVVGTTKLKVGYELYQKKTYITLRYKVHTWFMSVFGDIDVSTDRNTMENQVSVTLLDQSGQLMRASIDTEGSVSPTV